MIIRSMGLCLFCMASGHSPTHPSHNQAMQAMAVGPDGDLSNGPHRLMRNELPDGSLSEIEQGQVRAAQQAEMLEEAIPISASDIAYRAMDLLMGTTGMTEEDYPFACICNPEGVCEGDPAETTCKGRAGQQNAASRLSWVQALAAPALVLLFQLPIEFR
ncbi:dnaJ [Symbiodinium natans]|uniref:DnaJ protein n=1 Tax=Symbiodinium natans TaxID=878477 RepID=A0A812TRU9_9DINO|nr:dnaJ [Symbiodinium natans]